MILLDMNARETKKNIRIAENNLIESIRKQSEGMNKFGTAMSREGYAGGYLQCLSDIQLLMNDVQPTTRDYWDFLSNNLINELGKSAQKID